MAARAPIFELYQDRKKRYRWRLRARNGKIVADSAEAYLEARKALHGIEIVIQACVTRGAQGARIRDLTR